MYYKKGQTAVEFIILIAFVLFVFTAFFILVQSNMSDKINENQVRQIKELALAVQDEINLASDSTEGYYRTFKIPEKIGNTEYTLNITEGFVYVRTSNEKNAIALPVREITGNILKGDNSIRKNGGIVYLN